MEREALQSGLENLNGALAQITMPSLLWGNG